MIVSTVLWRLFSFVSAVNCHIMDLEVVVLFMFIAHLQISKIQVLMSFLKNLMLEGLLSPTHWQSTSIVSTYLYNNKVCSCMCGVVCTSRTPSTCTCEYIPVTTSHICTHTHTHMSSLVPSQCILFNHRSANTPSSSISHDLEISETTLHTHAYSQFSSQTAW